MGCHSKDVTSIFIDMPDSPVGSVVEIDGKCYIKTGLEGNITQTLSATPSTQSSCSSCLSGSLSGDE